MKPIQLNNVEKFAKDAAVSYIRFSDDVNETVCPYNLKKGDIKGNVTGFVDRLKTSLYPDGVYYMFLKDTLNGKERIVPVVKGEMPKEVPPAPVKGQAPAKEISPVLLAERKTTKTDSEMSEEATISYKEYMDLKIDYVTLQYENQRLQELIEEYENMEEDESVSPVSGFKDIIENLVLPLADKYFEIKTNELELLSAAKSKEVMQPKVVNQLKSFLKKKDTSAAAQYVRQPQAAPAPVQNAAPFIPDGAPQREELTEEELAVIEEIRGYDEEQIIDFYNKNSAAGQGENAMTIILSIRPEMAYLFEQNETEVGE